jgi:hypothetical protein
LHLRFFCGIICVDMKTRLTNSGCGCLVLIICAGLAVTGCVLVLRARGRADVVAIKGESAATTKAVVAQIFPNTNAPSGAEE